MTYLLRIAVCGLALITTSTAALLAGEAEEKGPADADRDDQLSAEGQRLSELLNRTLAEGSEARAMYQTIIEGGRMGPDEGWFRLAKAQYRFTWETVRAQYDRDASDSVTAQEFPGNKRDFARLDRNGDRELSAADFDWSESATERTPGYMLFYKADRDGNGKVTRDELVELFDDTAGGDRGFLSLDDFRYRLAPSTEGRGRRRGQGPTKDILIKGLYRQEIGSLQPGPGLDQPAPDFTLKTLDGQQVVTLSDVVGDKPVVLVFGNFTCSPFRSQAGNVEQVYRRYRDRAEFLFIYVREAHPIDGWRASGNDRVDITIAQPKNYEDRVRVAQTCQQHLDLDLPFLVDTIDDAVGAKYSGMPSRLYLIDRAGKVAYKSGRGPFGFKPAELEQSLLLLLAEQPPAAAAATPAE